MNDGINFAFSSPMTSGATQRYDKGESVMKLAKLPKASANEFDLTQGEVRSNAQHLVQEINVSAREFARTALLRADSGYRYVVAVLPPDKKIDLGKASKLLGGSKLEFATEFDIEKHFPNSEFGVLPPFGSRYGMKTIADISFAEDDDIWFAGNTHDETIQMKFAEFCRLEHPLVAPLAVEQ